MRGLALCATLAGAFAIANCGGSDESRRAPRDPGKDAAAETGGRSGSAGTTGGSAGTTGGSAGTTGGSAGTTGGSGGSTPDAAIDAGNDVSVDGALGTAGSGGADAAADAPVETGDATSDGGSTLGCIRAIQGEHYLRTDGRVYDFSGAPVVIEEAAGVPLSNATEIFEGDEHGCALKADGTVWCWALTNNGNGAGQLGSGAIGGTVVLRRAVQVRTGPADAGLPALTGAIHINSGSSRSYISSTTCAILQDTSLWCWGAVGNGGGGNFFNDGVSTSRPYAVRILASATAPLTGVSQAGLGRRHACVLRSGEVWCWGSNVYGALGLGNEAGQVYPTRVTLPGLAQQIGVSSDSSCALVAGAVYCWGLNNQGQLGVGTPVVETGCSSACSLSPKQVVDRVVDSGATPLTGVTDINVAYHAACARRADYSLYCWGNGSTDHASPLLMDAAPLTNVALYTTVSTGPITGALRVLTRDGVLKRQGATYNQVCP